MKLSLSLGLIVAASSTLAACSSDEGTPRTPSTGGMGAGGSPTAMAGRGGTSTGGSTAGGAGGGGGAPATNFTRGMALTLTADGNVTDATGATQINGGTFLSQSDNMTVAAVTNHRDGGLCFSGTTAVVPDTSSYGTYWGAELGLNLKLIADPAAPAPAADAGADAGAGPALIPDPDGWPYGSVVGFSYKVVGNNAAAPDRGVPVTRVRFKALPIIADGADNSYCSDRNALVDQKVEDVLFDDITFECWTPGNPSIGPNDDTINVVDPGPPLVVTTPPNPKALANISWQVASDIMGPNVAGPIAFDFCITELTPLLAP